MSMQLDHRGLIAYSSIVFFVLTLVIAILPAFEIEKIAALDGIVPLDPDSMEAEGRRLYIKEGCGTCHTQFVRNLPVDAPYGRGSLAGDYALEDPPLLGTQRTGPDLSNVGVRQPSDIWNLIHLYSPRTVVQKSVMPGYPWYFEEKDAASEGDVLVPVPDPFKPEGKVVVAKPEALAIVAYLKSLKQVEID